nr:MAG TPA: hypothetical protein [Caudoviricetes sp.]
MRTIFPRMMSRTGRRRCSSSAQKEISRFQHIVINY